jgi:hypothetical protein
MTENTARKYDYENVQAIPKRPAQVIPLHPTVWQRRKARVRTTLTPERVADIVLVGTTLLLSGVIFYVLYHGVQNYQIF